MAHTLTKEDVLRKLSPLGIKTVASVNNLIREQGLPANYFTPRKVYFLEEEIDTWMAKRPKEVAKANIDHIKAVRTQRKKRKEDPSIAHGFKAEIVPVKEAKA
jgi:hypothetical protein